MRLTIFQSNKGDCLLLSSGTAKKPVHVLVDGGMGISYRDHVAGDIAKLPHLDRVYVSHVDQDHIAGVLQLIDDAFEWRVYEMRKNRNPPPPKPERDKPPKIRGIWHNAFFDDPKRNAGDIEDMLIASAHVASASDDDDVRADAIRNEQYATSISEALQLSSRIGIRQLQLKVNEGTSKMMMAREEQAPIRVGPMKFTILGPFEEDLELLRKAWDKWLRSVKGQTAVKRLRTQSLADAKSIMASSFEDLNELMIEQARKLAGVTAPNHASLMMLVEEKGKRILLTGDGVGDTILQGLERTGVLEQGASLHVDVLKVQHHGAAANVKAPFTDRVTADHYVFCGNGSDDNPELPVVERLFKARMKVAGNFQFWFNSHSRVTDEKNRPHMRALQTKVQSLVRQSRGRLAAHFLQESSFPPLEI